MTITADPVRSKVSTADKMSRLSAKTESNRVRLRAGNVWLHWSGGFLTDNPQHAWSGTVDHHRACHRKFDAAAACKMVEV